MYVFISHSSSDAKIASEACSLLENGGHKCFLAPRDIRAGREYAEEIMNGIDRSDVCLFLLSQKSNQSPHVLREIERAVSKSIPIFVYQLEDVTLTKSMEYFLMTHQWMNTKHENDIEVIKRELDEFEKKGTENHITEINQKEILKVSDTEEQKRIKKKSFQAVILAAIVVFVSLIGLAVGINHSKINQKDLNKTESTVEPEIEIELSLGDTYEIGRYYDVPIKWRLVHFSDSDQRAYFVTQDVISIKPFDAAESGVYKYYYVDESGKHLPIEEMSDEMQIQYVGNNDWSKSNIRTWLNSASENIEYEDMPPVQYALNYFNAYQAEPGFLTCFSEEELQFLLETAVQTKGNSLSGQDSVLTNDKVFLLSKEETEWLQEANVNIFAFLTQEAADHDDYFLWNDSAYADGYQTEEIYYWLRDPAEDTCVRPYMVSNGSDGDFFSQEYYSGYDRIGIRPVICVDTERFKQYLINQERGLDSITEKQELTLGDRITIGTYLDKPIEWRVLHLNEDGETAVLITQDIVTMKAFDGAESGEFSYLYGDDEETLSDEDKVLRTGNSCWRDSNLRTWLNSSDITVIYEDQSPVKDAMATRGKGYQTEKGFLCDFTEEERALLQLTDIVTAGTDYTDSRVITTKDTVYLLSEDEISWFKEANVNRYAKPTQEAIDQDVTKTYLEYFHKEYCVDYHYYWLRDSYKGYANRNVVFCNEIQDEETSEYYPSYDWVGVRPAITVNIQKVLEFEHK